MQVQTGERDGLERRAFDGFPFVLKLVGEGVCSVYAALWLSSARRLSFSSLGTVLSPQGVFVVVSRLPSPPPWSRSRSLSHLLLSNYPASIIHRITHTHTLAHPRNEHPARSPQPTQPPAVGVPTRFIAWCSSPWSPGAAKPTSIGQPTPFPPLPSPIRPSLPAQPKPRTPVVGPVQSLTGPPSASEARLWHPHWPSSLVPRRHAVLGPVV